METRDIQALTQLQKKSLVRAGRKLNTSLDLIFYDTGSLTAEETAGLSAYANPEGSILVVHPIKENRKIINQTPLKFISTQNQTPSNPIDAVVIAGVGSSALGTAALARNVADYLNRPVAGIVSGFGLADVVTEALGGWFVLGFKNSIRDAFAKMFDAVEIKDHVWDDISYKSLVENKEIEDFNMDRFVFGSPDSGALLLVLYHLRNRIKVLVGHSKGNYAIENALEGLVSLCRLKNREIPEDLQVVTMGAVVRFPEAFSNIRQFIGTMDAFGMFNSRLTLHPTWVGGAWHSLNTHWVGHMPVQEMLKTAGVQ